MKRDGTIRTNKVKFKPTPHDRIRPLGSARSPQSEPGIMSFPASSSSSAPATQSKLFQKRRRAYIACSNCRRRKIKCITASDADYRPCTRCASKGLVCEYLSVGGDDADAHSGGRRSLTPTSGDPSPTGDDASPSPCASPASPSGWPNMITPPSAGLSGFMPPPRSAPARRNSHAAAAAASPTTSSLYRPQTWPSGAGVSGPAVSSSRISQPRSPQTPTFASGMVAASSVPMPYSAFPPTPSSAAYPAIQPPYPSGFGQQPEYAWPQHRSGCVCPAETTQCYCGANAGYR
ncbi:C6 finger domain [Mycena kentingensis (nom. inval.)]|nr:C6 finger domain [Mycena kentingensis (nom. inval.)]